MLTCLNSNQQPWNSTLPTLTHLPNCKTQFDINQIHARLLTTGFIKNSYLTTKLVLNFASSPHTPLIQFARHIFFSQFIPRNSKTEDPFLWNAVIKTFSHGDDPKQAVFVFRLMLENRACVDNFSFSLVLKACSRMGSIREGMQVHGFLIKIGLTGDLYLQNCLISMYVRSGCIEFARQVFDTMHNRDSISCNSMIDGYVKCGMITSARELFDSMPSHMKNLRSWNCMISGYAVMEDGFSLAWELFDKMPNRDLVSWNLMIRCCVKSGKIDLAHTLFDKMPEKDVISWAKLIDGYAKLSNINTARQLFDEMPQRDIISCNIIMAGYLQNGNSSEALNIFHNIMRDKNLTPDDTTLSIALSAISHLGYTHEGIIIHTYITEKRLKLEGKLGVSLIDMYSKSGMIETAIHVFKTLNHKNIDHYNAMIGGLAIHGFGKQAFDTFLEIQTLKIKPDAITFLNVLNACAHSGLLKEGVICFKIMTKHHKIKPQIQHFGCLIDMFARAGHIQEAMNVINQMPFQPNSVMWRALFSSCKNLENTIEMKTPILMDCDDSSDYILLSNIYARFGMWEFVRKVRGMMKERKMKKVPGRSWIELDGSFHEFYVGDGCHPQVEEIYSVLDNWCNVKSFKLEPKFESDLFLIGS